MSDYEPKCKKTLPIIFDDRMPASNLTPKLVGRVNDNTEDLKNLYEETDTMQGDIESLQEDVDDKLNIPETAGSSGQVLTSDGEGGSVWANVGSGEIVVDPTLTVEGAAADAKETGDQLTHVKEDINELSDITTKVINLIDESTLVDNKYYDPNTGAITTGNHTTQLVPLIPVSSGNYYFYTNFSGSQFFSFVVFNADKTYSRFVSTADIRYRSPVVTISGTEAYVGITLYNTQVGKTAFVESKYKGYFVGLENTANVIPPHIVANRESLGTTLIVDKMGDGDFTTINDAVLSISDDSADKPYTIYIKPGIYKEVVAIQGGRHISLIGENMKDCIIRDDTGLYANCPVQIGGDFLLENLTIIATHDDNPTMSHTGNKAYAVHIDYAGEGTGIVRNCKLVSYQSSALGIGLHQNQTLIVEDCDINSYTPNANSWDSGSDWTTTPSYGAFYAHSAITSNVTGQKLIVKDNMITSANKCNCAFANSPDGTSNMDIILANNNFWCADGVANSTVTEWYTPTYNQRSYGNNILKFNP